jgi:hypothetical protein
MTKKICISIPVELHQRLAEYCQQNHRKKATTIHWALTRLLDAEQPKHQPITAARKAKQRQLELA